jgi:hypothetical protein
METSTKLIVLGIALLFVPFPPFATIAGGVSIAAGVIGKLL